MLQPALCLVPGHPSPVLSYFSLLVRSRFQPTKWSLPHHCAICDLWGPELLWFRPQLPTGCECLANSRQIVVGATLGSQVLTISLPCVPAAGGRLRVQIHSTHAAPHLATIPGGMHIEEEGAAGQGDPPSGLPYQHNGHTAQAPGCPTVPHPAGLWGLETCGPGPTMPFLCAHSDPSQYSSFCPQITWFWGSKFSSLPPNSYKNQWVKPRIMNGNSLAKYLSPFSFSWVGGRQWNELFTLTH